MDGEAAGFLAGVRKCFAELRDPRVQASCAHSLFDIVSITILAVTCGADDCTDLETFGKKRREWLATFLELRGGIPSHDTFRRVLGLLDRKQFAACLLPWTQALHEASGGKLIAIDGKALRRSARKKSGLGMLHLVTAWSSENGLTLAQVACDEKSNEITAIPEVLKLLDIKGCTITIDAMGCQKEIAQQIRSQKGHYVLTLKGNQSGLNTDMELLYHTAAANDFVGFKHEVVTSTQRGHGRLDERTCQVIEIPKDHPRRAEWAGRRSLAIVVSRREIAGQEQWESRLDISSLPAKAQPLAQAIRKHWSIENGQHWVLDIAFGEDSRRPQDRHGGANLATIRRLSLSLLRQDTSLKRGIKAKRFACALDPNDLLQVFQQGQIDA